MAQDTPMSSSPPNPPRGVHAGPVDTHHTPVSRETERTPIGAVVNREGSYVDWPCALAGAFVAGAVSFVLMTFGSGIGLSMVSPWPTAGATTFTVLVLAALWAIFVHVTAFGAGGYIAGRMRRPWLDAKGDEVQFRDGVHGALVWAIGVVIGASLIATTATGLLQSGAQGAAGAMTSQQSNTSSSSVTTAAVDALFRPNGRPPQSASEQDVRVEATRMLATAVSQGSPSTADRSYLAQVVAARTGISPADADARITQAVNTARSAADQARVGAVMGAFLAAATLLLAAAAAWTAATMGGAHREDGTIWRGFRSMPLPRRSGERT